MDFQCKRCGNCCKKAGSVLHITQNDYERWVEEDRWDIISKIVPVSYCCENCNISWGLPFGDTCRRCDMPGKLLFYWIDPKYQFNYFAQLMGNPKCPFLRKVRNKPQYTCRIHDTKPEICRDFPFLEVSSVTGNEEECIEWDCEGYKEWEKIHRK